MIVKKSSGIGHGGCCFSSVLETTRDELLPPQTAEHCGWLVAGRLCDEKAVHT